MFSVATSFPSFAEFSQGVHKTSGLRGLGLKLFVEVTGLKCVGVEKPSNRNPNQEYIADVCCAPKP